MKIDAKTVLKMARLARIELNADEIQQMQNSLNGIFSWIDQLNEVNIQGVEPLFNVTLEKMPMRKDQVDAGGYVQEILNNAPDTQFDMFSVPKVVE